MKIIEIQEDAYSRRLKKPHNSPISVDDMLFQKEYHILYNNIETALLEYGKNDVYGQGDYCLENSIIASRGLGFEITNDKIVTQAFLSRFQNIVIKNAGWEIFLQSGTFDWGIFIGHSIIHLYRKSGDLLKTVLP